MNDVVKLMKTQFAESTAVKAAVSTRCSFAIEIQDVKTPFIAYNVRELEKLSKDNFREYELVIAVVASNIKSLLDTYEVVKQVMEDEVTQCYSAFEGSSYPDTAEKDDHYIVELNFNIKK